VPKGSGIRARNLMMKEKSMLLEGKVALVTGAGSGIGAAAARLMAKEGAKIGALGRTESELDKVVKQIKKAGGEAITLVADTSEPEAMEKATQQLVKAYGRLDIVVPNAGINGVWAPLEDLTPEDWDKTLTINLKGTFLSVKYAIPHLKKRGGSVVIVASINGTRTFTSAGATAYSCSKAGQVAFAKMAAVELGQHKIRVNVVCPGAIDTLIDENTEKINTEKAEVPVEFPEGDIPLTKGEPGSAKQVADLILFLASDQASHISGTEVWIDGGQSLLR